MFAGSSKGQHYGSASSEARTGHCSVTSESAATSGRAGSWASTTASVVPRERRRERAAGQSFSGRRRAMLKSVLPGIATRNGRGLDPSGTFVSEHVRAAGSQVNASRRGANYGWPGISYGRTYSVQIGEGTRRRMDMPPQFLGPYSFVPTSE